MQDIVKASYKLTRQPCDEEAILGGVTVLLGQKETNDIGVRY